MLIPKENLFTGFKILLKSLQTLVDANLRQRFGVIVVGIQRRDDRMEFNPPPDSTIRGGDKLVVLGRADSLKQLGVEASKP